jgi:hypothetical protein
MKTLVLLAALLASGTAFAQNTQQQSADFDYNYLELRFVDVDNNGDGLRFGGSFDFGNNWLLVGGVTSLDYNNNVDATSYEIGAGYVWHYTSDWDMVATLRYINVEIDNPGQGFDDDGLAFSGGVRGWLVPKFELRGSVNHVTAGDSDTYLELAGDYHFTPRFAAGLSLEFAGDNDIWTIGGRWFFE